MTLVRDWIRAWIKIYIRHTENTYCRELLPYNQSCGQRALNDRHNSPKALLAVIAPYLSQFPLCKRQNARDIMPFMMYPTFIRERRGTGLILNEYIDLQENVHANVLS